MKLPRILVGAASSGAGKTSLVLGLLEALGRRGLDVRPFKTGPDYLDTALHTALRGLPSRNLDPALMGAKATLACLARSSLGGDLALIEGVMGYYDGGSASSAALARLLRAPAILALDASAAAESVAAVALGFLRYTPRSGIVAFVANRIGSEAHYAMVKRAVEARCGLPLLGYLPRESALILPERHLGLLAPGENPDFRRAVAALGDAVSAHIDLDALLALAASAPELTEPELRAPAGSGGASQSGGVSRSGESVLRIAVARDEAFSFYYEDNLDALRELGAELAFFSPLRDPALPAGSSALYLGGGYPELHGPALAANASLRAAIREAAAEGLPIYAECGGYLYLLERIEGPDGVSHEACGLLSGRSRHGARLAALGYREAHTLAPSILGPAGRRLRGHVFHWSSLEAAEGEPALALARRDQGKRGAAPSARAETPSLEGQIRGSVFASWLHVHFAGNPGLARTFVAAARRFERARRSAWPDPAETLYKPAGR